MPVFQVEIVGESPLLISRFTEQEESQKSTRKMVVNRDPRAEAQDRAYVDPTNKTFYFNAMSIPGTMGNAGANHKMKSSRKSLKFIVPSAVRMDVEGITILGEDGKPAKTFEVDARPVTIPATKGRIMRYRPRWNKWMARFNLHVNTDLLGVEDAQRLLTEAGQIIGIGDFRPEKRGPFGTFRVTSFQPLEKPKK